MGAMLIVGTLFAQMATAQKNDEDKRFSGGFGIEPGYTRQRVKLTSEYGGNTESASAVEFGLSGRFAAKVGPGWITLTPGFGVVVPTEDNDVEDPEVINRYFGKLGYKYIFAKYLFVMGEGGYAHYTDDEGEEGNGGPCFAVSFGGNFKVFELGLKYEMTSLSKKYDYVSSQSFSTIGLRIGFNF